MLLRRARVFVILGLLTGCAGIIGVPDLTLEESPVLDDAGPRDASRFDVAQADGQVVAPIDATVNDVGVEASRDANAGDDADADAGTDGATSCASPSLDSDPKNCGFCGHDCRGAACTAGLCEPTSLGTLGLYFDAMVEYGDYVYVGLTRDETIGSEMYRAAKTPSHPVATPIVFGKHSDVAGMVVLGKRLYFVVYEDKESGGSSHGGLWSCPLDTDDPCADPTFHAASYQPWSISTDGKAIYYADYNDGIYRFDPDTNLASAWRPNDAYSWPNIDARGNDLFYLHLDYNGTVRNPLTLRYANAIGDDYETADTYPGNDLLAGQLFGTDKALYYTVYEVDDSAAHGGLVRRVARPSAADAGAGVTTTCSYGRDSNFGPSGLFIDPDRIYWTNRGSATQALTGSVNVCPLAESGDCCETPTRLWKGTARPNAVTADTAWVYWATLDGDIMKVAK